MKKLKKMLLIVCAFMIIPNMASAFELAPVAFLTFDKTQKLDSDLQSELAAKIKMGFYFPNYQIVEPQQVQTALKNKLPQLVAKQKYYDKVQMQKIAEIIPADVVFAVFVDSFDQYVVNSSGFILDPVQNVRVYANIVAYDKKRDLYNVTQVSYWKSEPLPIAQSANQVLLDGMEKAVNDLSNKIKSS